MTAGELAELRRHFQTAPDYAFWNSPLYRAFCPAVADDPPTLALLTGRAAGQQPSFLLFAAVQYLLLRGADHPLAALFADAAERRPVPVDAGEVFLDFAHHNSEAIARLAGTRLVQTNVVRRVVGLRYALSVVATRTPAAVHLIEIGASAGIHLGVGRYRIAFGSRLVGPAAAALTVDTELRGAPGADLAAVPAIASRTAVDLRPVDVTDADQRLWLRALVWPENRADADLLDRALQITAEDPPRVIAGDAIDVCPALAEQLPAGEPRVVFHAATRMHVPRDRWPAFDAAIDEMGRSAPLFHVWQESADVTHGGGAPVHSRAGLYLHGPEGDITPLAAIDGHGAWIEPLSSDPGR